MSVELAAAKLNKAIVKLSITDIDAIVKEFYVLSAKQQKIFAEHIKDVELTPKQQNHLVVADVAWTLKNVPDLSVLTQNLILSRYLKHRVALYGASKNFSKISIKLITAMMNSKKVNAKIIGGMINAVGTQKAKRVILQKYPTSVRYSPEKVRLIRSTADMVIETSEALAKFIRIVKPKPKDDVSPVTPVVSEEKLTRRQLIEANRKKLKESAPVLKEPAAKPRAARKEIEIEEPAAKPRAASRKKEIEEPVAKPRAARKEIEIEEPVAKPRAASRKKEIEIEEPVAKPRAASRKKEIEIEEPAAKPRAASRKKEIEEPVAKQTKEASILERLRGIKIIDADKSKLSKGELVEANKEIIRNESTVKPKTPKRGIKPASSIRIDDISAVEPEEKPVDAKPVGPKRGTKKITPPVAELFEDDDDVDLPDLPEKKSGDDTVKKIDVKGIRGRLLDRQKAEAEKLAAAKAEKLAAAKAEKLAAAKAEKLAEEKAEKLAAAKAEKLAEEKAEKLANDARREAAKAPRTRRPKNEQEEDDSVDEVTMPKISAKITKQIAAISEILETSIDNFDTKLFQQTAASSLEGESTRLDTYLNKVIEEASLVRAAKREGINSLYLMLATIGDMETYLTENQKELLSAAEEFLNRSPDSVDTKTDNGAEDEDDFSAPNTEEEEEEDTVVQEPEDEDTVVQEPEEEDTVLDDDVNTNPYEEEEEEETDEFAEAYATVVESIKDNLVENDIDEDLLDADLENALTGKVSKNLEKALRELMTEEYEEAVENNISPLLLLILVLMPEILDNKSLPKQLRKDLVMTKRFLDGNNEESSETEVSTEDVDSVPVAQKQKSVAVEEEEVDYDDEDNSDQEPEYQPRGRKSKSVDFDELDADSDVSDWNQEDRFSGSSAKSSLSSKSGLKNVIKISAEEERKYVLLLKKALKILFKSDKFKASFKESIGRKELMAYVLANAKNLMPKDVANELVNLPNLVLDSIFKIVVPVEKINLKKTSNVQKDFLDAATTIVKKVGDYSSRKNVSSMQRLLMSLGTKFGVDIKSISVKPGGELRMRVELNEKDQFIVVYDLDTGNYSII